MRGEWPLSHAPSAGGALGGCGRRSSKTSETGPSARPLAASTELGSGGSSRLTLALSSGSLPAAAMANLETMEAVLPQENGFMSQTGLEWTASRKPQAGRVVVEADIQATPRTRT